jgi:hypothetical protein
MFCHATPVTVKQKQKPEDRVGNDPCIVKLAARAIHVNQC